MCVCAVYLFSPDLCIASEIIGLNSYIKDRYFGLDGYDLHTGFVFNPHYHLQGSQLDMGHLSWIADWICCCFLLHLTSEAIMYC